MLMLIFVFSNSLESKQLPSVLPLNSVGTFMVPNTFSDLLTFHQPSSSPHTQEMSQFKRQMKFKLKLNMD